jgi:hypothetical protein
MIQLHFKPENYGNSFSNLIDPQRINELGPGQPEQTFKARINSLKIEQAFAPNPITDRNHANACLSGIWLHLDFLSESHRISQNIPTDSGSFWHGIMHRREGDYWNSKYWFRQVGDHPILSVLQSGVVQFVNWNELPELRNKSWNPFLFIDIVQKYNGTNSDMEIICKKIQQLEWQLLFDYCYKQAIT